MTDKEKRLRITRQYETVAQQKFLSDMHNQLLDMQGKIQFEIEAINKREV